MIAQSVCVMRISSSPVAAWPAAAPAAARNRSCCCTIGEIRPAAARTTAASPGSRPSTIAGSDRGSGQATTHRLSRGRNGSSAWLVQATWIRVQTAREASDHPSLISDCGAYLDACAEPAFTRITADGPAVLGWDYLVAQTSPLIEIGLADARDRGEIIDVPLGLLSRMLAAALKEAGVIIATADDPAGARDQADQTARHLIAGLLTANQERYEQPK